MKVGDLCSIWNGKSPISDPKQWPIGVVAKVRSEPWTGVVQCQVHWSDGVLDRTWYRDREVKLVKRPT
jgi:hypothetical protein